MSDTKRIFMIHAVQVAIDPINEAFKRLWPGVTTSNLLDDSLSADPLRAGVSGQSLRERLIMLGRYAESTGADGILFTCSSLGAAVTGCREAVSIPVMKPNEAMVEQALQLGRRITILATSESAIGPISEEFHAAAAAQGGVVEIESRVIAGAMQALCCGDVAAHDRLIGEMAATVSGRDVVCFAQISKTSAADSCQLVLDCPLLTTPDSAVLKLRETLEG